MRRAGKAVYRRVRRERRAFLTRHWWRFLAVAVMWTGLGGLVAWPNLLLVIETKWTSQRLQPDSASLLRAAEQAHRNARTIRLAIQHPQRQVGAGPPRHAE